MSAALTVYPRPAKPCATTVVPEGGELPPDEPEAEVAEAPAEAVTDVAEPAETSDETTEPAADEPVE